MKKKTIYCTMLFILLTANIAHAGMLIDNGDGTISDQGTHLMWQKQDDGTTQTWEVGITYCSELTLAGHSDWRLPTIKELTSITDMTKIFPAINTTYFPGTKSFWYWSSTTFAGDATTAWMVTFYFGTEGYGLKINESYTRCVR